MNCAFILLITLLFVLGLVSCFKDGRITNEILKSGSFLNHEQQFISNKHLIVSSLQQICHQHPNISSDRLKLLFCSHAKNHYFSTPIGPKDLTFYLESEHNVVVDDISQTQGRPVLKGKIPSLTDGNKTYLLRIDGPECLHQAAIVLEYSNMNTENIRLSGHYNDPKFIDKIVYIPAIPYEYEPFAGKHNIPVITSFLNGYGRRAIIHQQLQHNITNGTTNVVGVKYNSLDELKKVFDSARILVNVHQTDFHHTLEEFRILPALLRGIVIVSEWIPIPHVVPYADYVIFVPYSQLVQKTMEVNANYEKYHEKFFGKDSKLNETIQAMKAQSYKHLERLVLEKYPH